VLLRCWWPVLLRCWWQCCGEGSQWAACCGVPVCGWQGRLRRERGGCVVEDPRRGVARERAAVARRQMVVPADGSGSQVMVTSWSMPAAPAAQVSCA
jgi:hypothetical protein